ncbi:MAG: hypothetical protein GX947_00270, partial [Tissierellia bacterium]|nr:hypothetical protein [Tissierellia bacterium]
KDLEKRLAKMDIHIKVTEATRDHIAKEGFDAVYGARPLERTIRKMIEDQLAEEILSGTVNKDDEIVIDYEGDHLVFNKGL